MIYDFFSTASQLGASALNAQQASIINALSWGIVTPEGQEITADKHYYPGSYITCSTCRTPIAAFVRTVRYGDKLDEKHFYAMPGATVMNYTPVISPCNHTGKFGGELGPALYAVLFGEDL